MSYFNYKLAESLGLSARDVHLLQMLKQNRTEDLSEQLQLEMDGENIKRLKSLDLMTMVKAKRKSDSEFKRLRLSKKGNQWYNKIQTADTVENDFQMFEYVKKVYKAMDKKIGDETNTINLIAWFRCQTGFTHKQIFVIIDTFLKDSRQLEYSHVLERIFWVRPHVHAVRPELKDSRLWKYYSENKETINLKFEKLTDE